MAEMEGPRLSNHQPRARLYVRAVIYHLGRGSRVVCPMVENEGGPAHRRLVIRSTSSKPWPTPRRSTSSHIVERHPYKLLQPLRILRSDNCVSEQDSFLDATDRNARRRIPSSPHENNECVHILRTWKEDPRPRDVMHGCVRIARPRVPRSPVPSSAGRCRLERAAVKPSMRRWCLCLHRWRCLGPKICRIKAAHVAGWQVWTRRHAWLSLSRCTVSVRSIPAFLGDALGLALGLATSALPRYHTHLGKTYLTAVCAAL